MTEEIAHCTKVLEKYTIFCAELMENMTVPNDRNEAEEFEKYRVNAVETLKEINVLARRQTNCFNSLMKTEIRNELTPEIIDEKWKEKLEECQDHDSSRAAAFDLIVNNIRSQREEEMEVMQMQYSRKDPISKKDIVTPVRTKRCPHVYDLESITEFAKKKSTLKCAVQGCSAKLVISELEEWPEFFKHCKD
ncbi:unnamed protein product [Caenorhabditis bovis]|uniref:E3 SUMO-protein ligase NSE2 n=1 Tax=Caenorhabditis bovis TaxID=2654633 RepID=A0A8S1FEQ1_9PELO|nr:unnamed protein product [Caenorhabditis bovis]